MDYSTRVVVAYLLIAAVAIIAGTVAVIQYRKRQRQNLRRRGIKRHGH
ncbi:hypothetical protein [Sphingomonas panaciterrae]